MKPARVGSKHAQQFPSARNSARAVLQPGGIGGVGSAGVVGGGGTGAGGGGGDGDGGDGDESETLFAAHHLTMGSRSLNSSIIHKEVSELSDLIAEAAATPPPSGATNAAR